MKIIKLIQLFLFAFFLHSCTTNTNSEEIIINKSLKEYNHFGKAIFFRTNENSYIKNSESYSFLTSKELLNNLDENFFLLKISKNEKFDTVNLYNFKSGKSLTCIYNKNNLIEKNIIMIKPMPSKPYYIYYEILKRKYPKYMNWKLFSIPKDSLK